MLSLIFTARLVVAGDNIILLNSAIDQQGPDTMLTKKKHGSQVASIVILLFCIIAAFNEVPSDTRQINGSQPATLLHNLAVASDRHHRMDIFHQLAPFFDKRNSDFDPVENIACNLPIVYAGLHLGAEAVKVLNYAPVKRPAGPDTVDIGLMVRIIDAYVSLGEYGFAEVYYKRIAYSIRDRGKTDVVTQNARLTVIRLLIVTRQFARLPYLFKVCRYAAEKTADMKFITSVEQLQYKADSAQGKYLSALQHHKMYMFYNESLVRRNHDKRLAEMQVQFEAAGKDTALAQQLRRIGMLGRQYELQQQMLRSHRLVRNLSFLGVALFALLLIVGFSRYQLKQIANRHLQEKQEEVNRQNEHLRDLLTEREWLLKEIHHRVKNNLQIIISLLNSQSVYLTDLNALNVLQKSQNRIFSVSLIHQKLYQEGNISGISMKSYISELTIHLSKTFGTTDRIHFRLLAEDVLLDVGEAVPLGLILNEAVTNAMKYAFPDGVEGTISIFLAMESKEWLILEIADNGTGLAEEIDLDNPSTLGMSLIRGLSDQLGAVLTLTGFPGVTIRMRWKRNIHL
jgi:two-component sensor histidine kinase